MHNGEVLFAGGKLTGAVPRQIIRRPLYQGAGASASRLHQGCGESPCGV
jgi:hypothetical protein